MKNLETNALRIAEIMGYSLDNIDFKIASKELFTKYNGLMPIVFECNRSNINPNVSIHLNDVQVWIMQDDEYLIDPITYHRFEESFIEAIQECVIKYLELKCQQRNIADNIE